MHQTTHGLVKARSTTSQSDNFHKSLNKLMTHLVPEEGVDILVPMGLHGTLCVGFTCLGASFSMASCGGEVPATSLSDTDETRQHDNGAEMLVEFRSEDASAPVRIALGELPNSGEFNGVIHCVNRSTESINLSLAQTSCGCLRVVGSLLPPMGSGDMTISLRSSNTSSRQGEVAVYIPVEEGYVRTIQLTWSRATSPVLIAELSDGGNARAAISGVVSIDVIGLRPLDGSSEPAAPAPELRILAADGEWRAVAATWTITQSPTFEGSAAVAVWVCQCTVRYEDLNGFFEPERSEDGILLRRGARDSARISLRVDAPGWTASPPINFRLLNDQYVSTSTVSLL